MTPNPHLQNKLLPSTKDLIQKYHLNAKKSLGQHFLLDPRVNQQIVDLAGDIGQKHIIEVGPGPGGLTRAILANKAKSVIAVEVDERAIQLLQELKQFYPDQLQIVQHDALTFDLSNLCPAPRQIISNLPYNIGTPLLLNWLKQAHQWQRLTLMFQQEVAYRICAAPSTEFYGRLSVITQWIAECSIVKQIPPGAFLPAPKVYSSVINIVPKKEQPSPALFRTMQRITAAAFGQRRKMLRSSLKSMDGANILTQANIDDKRRAETLTIAEFDLLAHLYLQNNPG